MNRHRMLAPLLAVTALLGVAGCRPDFAPFNRLTGLRVLGIQAEPPTPAIGETTTLSALVFTPTPDPTLTYHWSWCPVAASSSQGYECLVKEQDLDGYLAAAGLPNLPAFDLGTGETATFTNTIDASVFLAACSGDLPGEPGTVVIDCSAGFSTQVTLTVTTATDTVTAVQTLKLRFPLPGGVEIPANANPAITGLSASPGGVVMPIDAAGTVLLPRDVETTLGADIDISAAETYPDGSSVTGVSTERLFTTWFVETGDTHDQRTSYIAGSTTFGDMLRNGWTPAVTKDYPSPTARIYAVLHDNREGTSWTSGMVTLGSTP